MLKQCLEGLNLPMIVCLMILRNPFQLKTTQHKCSSSRMVRRFVSVHLCVAQHSNIFISVNSARFALNTPTKHRKLLLVRSIPWPLDNTYLLSRRQRVETATFMICVNLLKINKNNEFN